MPARLGLSLAAAVRGGRALERGDEKTVLGGSRLKPFHTIQNMSLKASVQCDPRPSSGQRESFFRSRDENESFSDSISFIETRPRVPDTYSQASRRDREFLTLTLGHRDEIEIYYLHSQASRREREFP